MGAVLGDLLPLAMGVAISPIPIVAAILLILTNTAAGAGPGFAAGWCAGIAVVTAVVAALAGTLGDTDAREPSAAVSWIKIVLGLVLLFLAAGQWRVRADTTPPRWMRAIGELTTIRSAGLGTALSALNPKNLLLCVSAGTTIGTGGLGGGAEIVAIAVFTVLAGASVLAVVLCYALAAERLRGRLDTARHWLQAQNHAVLAIVLLVMGTVVLGKGIGGL
ncbi:GAP family protein [Nocardia blacklockiae]|uniref:GAP family protein n=1 Tax=Nocardia blacklockiae TaxID=480036 RepID=UPI0018955262|nr:GAP family protein [Nocardia blacklockiae]MBF6173835.1 GAP family protein [Nocardia blacklockiae]